jgi:hypothetical protein
LFAGGATAHAGVGIPLGVGTWEEPLLVPAAIIEGAGAAGLLLSLIAVAARASWAYRAAWWVLWYCFAGVLWGMGRLAVGSIPEARTMTNDFLHIGMTLLSRGQSNGVMPFRVGQVRRLRGHTLCSHPL